MSMHELRGKIIAEKDARIAELTAEVGRLRKAIAWIADDCNAPESVRVFARNTLKEG